MQRANSCESTEMNCEFFFFRLLFLHANDIKKKSNKMG